MSKKNYPTVVLVGRTNVGKSTIFNRLSAQERSIVFDAPGVTRDVIKDLVSWQDKTFELIDTGGVSFGKSEDPFIQEIRDRALGQLEGASVILFVCDGSIGVVPEDRQIARMLHKLKKSVLLIVNKTDTRQSQEYLHDFERLGFPERIEISALHSKGILDILEGILRHLPAETPIIEEDSACRVVLLGKPNVGKSSLLNLLVQEERSIVSSIPGTTREPVSERIRFYQEDILLVDTAGVRKKRSVEDPLEMLMAKSTLHAVKDADIVLLMVDASEGKLADQELKLAFYAFEQEQKALIILFNKQDLLKQDGYAQEQLANELEEYEFLMKRVEQLSISCTTGQNIGKVLALVQKVYERTKLQFTLEDLTMLFKEALQRRPLYKNQQMLVVYRAHQIKSSPHIIAMYVNNADFFGKSQCAFFEGILRDKYDLRGVPIKFVIRKR